MLLFYLLYVTRKFQLLLKNHGSWPSSIFAFVSILIQEIFPHALADHKSFLRIHRFQWVIVAWPKAWCHYFTLLPLRMEKFLGPERVSCGSTRQWFWLSKRFLDGPNLFPLSPLTRSLSHLFLSLKPGPSKTHLDSWDRRRNTHVCGTRLTPKTSPIHDYAIRDRFANFDFWNKSCT